MSILLVGIALLLIVAWLSVMYLWYAEGRGHEMNAIDSAYIERVLETVARFTPSRLV